LCNTANSYHLRRQVDIPFKGIIYPYWASRCNSITRQSIVPESFKASASLLVYNEKNFKFWHMDFFVGDVISGEGLGLFG